jgi:hypothetical protein
MKEADPVGVDCWPFELALKHGIRDGYLCPVGGRWVVGFWSRRVLENGFTQQARGLLNMAAAAAAFRLERPIGDDVKRVEFAREFDTERGAHTTACGRRQNCIGNRRRTRAGSGIGAKPFQEGGNEARDSQSNADCAEALRQLLII